MDVKADVTIFLKYLKKYEEEGRTHAEQCYDGEFINDYDPLEFQGEIRGADVYFEDDELCVAGDVRYGTDDIAHVYLSIPIDMEMMLMFMEYIFEKLQAIKKLLSKKY